jgi:hypothetical protein
MSPVDARDMASHALAARVRAHVLRAADMSRHVHPHSRATDLHRSAEQRLQNIGFSQFNQWQFQQTIGNYFQARAAAQRLTAVSTDGTRIDAHRRDDSSLCCSQIDPLLVVVNSVVVVTPGKIKKRAAPSRATR